MCLACSTPGRGENFRDECRPARAAARVDRGWYEGAGSESADHAHVVTSGGTRPYAVVRPLAFQIALPAGDPNRASRAPVRESPTGILARLFRAPGKSAPSNEEVKRG